VNRLGKQKRSVSFVLVRKRYRQPGKAYRRKSVTWVFAAVLPGQLRCGDLAEGEGEKSQDGCGVVIFNKDKGTRNAFLPVAPGCATEKGVEWCDPAVEPGAVVVTGERGYREQSRSSRCFMDFFNRSEGAGAQEDRKQSLQPRRGG
jgi:hypothetical protein